MVSGSCSLHPGFFVDVLSWSNAEVKESSAYPEELAERRVVWFARLSLDVFQVLRKPKSQDFQHAPERLI
jgi:hypothetical protein